MKKISSVRVLGAVLLTLLTAVGFINVARSAGFGPTPYCMVFTQTSPASSPSQCVVITAAVRTTGTTGWEERIALNFPFQSPCQIVTVEKIGIRNEVETYHTMQTYSNVCALNPGQVGPLCGNTNDTYTVRVNIKNTAILGNTMVPFTATMSAYPPQSPED